MMSRILIVGNNIPDITLWRMLYARIDVNLHQYMQGFERYNLIDAHKIINERGRTILLLGAEAPEAFNIPPVLIHPQQSGGCTWRQIPHPNVDREWYNVDTNRVLVELLMEQLYEDYQGAKRERCVL